MLRFPPIAGLRPTPDRVREDLFNWLGQRLDGRRCLDAFAGSGALGFEAASRGADAVVLVEADREACQALRSNCGLLRADRVSVVAGDALAYLAGDCGSFDVIFLDPPFAAGLLPEALARAATHLAPEGRIYAEFGGAGQGGEPDLGAWRVLREGRAGKSRYCLLESV